MPDRSNRNLFFRYKRRLLGELRQAAMRAFLVCFEAMAGTELSPGVVAVIQTFGDRINFHPHLHFLVTEGGMDEAGVFHKVGPFDDDRLAEVFAREVKKGTVLFLLSPQAIQLHFQDDQHPGQGGAGEEG
jgi:hypothetical protein